MPISRVRFECMHLFYICVPDNIFTISPDVCPPIDENVGINRASYFYQILDFISFVAAGKNAYINEAILID